MKHGNINMQSHNDNLKGATNPLHIKNIHFCQRFGNKTIIKTLSLPKICIRGSSEYIFPSSLM